MKCKKTGLNVFVLAFLLLIPCTAAASEIKMDGSTADTAYNENDIAKWVTSHKHSGGKLSLGANITIKNTIIINASSGSPIIIDAGKYGLVFDGGEISTENTDWLEIKGEGVDVPVIEVRKMGDDLWGDWNNLLMCLNITAVGRNGMGGTALRIMQEKQGYFNMYPLNQQGCIRSFGRGAVGIEISRPITVKCLRVEVTGENSIAVAASQRTALYFCKLTAAGAGSVSASGPDIILDTCAVSGVPDQNVRIRNRTVIEETPEVAYIMVKQYSDLDLNRMSFYEATIFPLSGGDSYEKDYHRLRVFWDYDQYMAIDTKTPGKVQLKGKLPPILQGLGLDDSPLTLTVEVRDPVVPCIQSVDYGKGNDWDWFTLNLWKSYDPEKDNVILWRSDDEGKTWWDATWSEDIEWGDGWGSESFYFRYGDIDYPVQFILEQVGVGKSNVAAVFRHGELGFGDVDGDRTGTDRESDVSAIAAEAQADPNPDGDLGQENDSALGNNYYRPPYTNSNGQSNADQNVFADNPSFTIGEAADAEDPVSVPEGNSEAQETAGSYSKSNQNKTTPEIPVSSLIWITLTAAVLLSGALVIMYLFQRRRENHGQS